MPIFKIRKATILDFLLKDHDNYENFFFEFVKEIRTIPSYYCKQALFQFYVQFYLQKTNPKYKLKLKLSL